jgi:hypothetical protein
MKNKELKRRVKDLELFVNDLYRDNFHLRGRVVELKDRITLLENAWSKTDILPRIEALEETKGDPRRPWYSSCGEVRFGDAPPAEPKEHSLRSNE